MNEPDRLIDECDDEFVRALLAEGRRPVESKQRTLAVLAAVGVGSAVFSKAGWAAAATWKNAAVALFVVGSGAATYQWILPAVRGELPARQARVADGLTWLLESNAGLAPESPPGKRGQSDVPLPAPPAEAALPTEALLAEPSAAEAQSNGQTSPRVKAQEALSAPGRAARKARDASVASLPGSTLSVEVALLDKARAALRAGRPDLALTVLEKYSAEHPNGALQREAELVRVPALYQTGRRSEASSRAKRILAKHPSSLVADQLRVYVSP